MDLPAVTTRDGAADILSHVFENYLLGGNDSPLADRHAEGVIDTVLENLPRALATPSDAAVRGHLLWASTWPSAASKSPGAETRSTPCTRWSTD